MAFHLLKNINQFYKATKSVTKEPTINSWEPTLAPLPPFKKNGEGDQNAINYIILTFNKPPKDPLKGQQLNTNKDLFNVLLGY